MPIAHNNFRDFLGEAKIFGDPKNNSDPNTCCFFCCRTDSYTCDACEPHWDAQKQQVGRQENSEIQRRYAAILDSNGGDRDQTYQQYWQKVGTTTDREYCVSEKRASSRRATESEVEHL